MLSWINPKVTIRNAGEKGVGSFANAPISKDESIIVQGGQIVENVRLGEEFYQSIKDHCFQVDSGFHICPTTTEREQLDGIFNVNHSCNPNCGFHGQIVLVAMRDIEPGEELTFDYAMTDVNSDDVVCTEMKCFCGSVDCRHIITGDDWKQKALQKKYRGYFSTYVQEMIDGTIKQK